MALLEQNPLSVREEVSSTADALNPIQIECIDLFVRIAQFLGLPKSYGELYGYLFMAESPTCMDDCTEQLNMSKGAASQGLKHLRAFGAIKLVYVQGDRRDYYVAEQSIKLLASGYMKERVLPGLDDLQQRIDGLEAKLLHLSPAEQRNYQQRLQQLKGWQKKAKMIFPVINKLLLN